MADDLEIRRAIRAAAVRRHNAEHARKRAMKDLETLARQAHELGIPIATIAKDAGLSRPSVYALLKDS